jgi:hypothetical protein
MEQKERRLEKLPETGDRRVARPAFDEAMSKLHGRQPRIEEDQSSTTAYMKRVFPELFQEFSWGLLARLFVNSLIGMAFVVACWLLYRAFIYLFPGLSY